ncbi:sugar dehydrogenase [Blastococcus sp. TF02-09]|uniref:PQQ-dependent sugar dehydrogenase n=1 Tax=Blastococcus sp. TF02-09 TaxID=2250576 RepID=UPI000DEA90DD|nr:PQQ-dependent sugar dehydrogenase [Blastococcus sp. TF02-9]RBY77986.1 sugar dehydrogenase [Blastococcus sp. TF02-9]
MRADAARQRTRTGGALAAVVRVVVVAVMVAAGLVVAQGTAQAAPSLPPGFAVRDMPSGQSELLTDFAFAPDGSYFTTGKNGRVAWVSADGATVRTLATLPVVTNQDLGLSGIAVAHDYNTSKVIYLARTLMVNNQWTMRLSAFTVVSATTPTSLSGERVVWDLPIGSDVHTITGIIAAPDGTLWVTMGDAADFRFVDAAALRSLDVNTGYGKLLHVLPDGRGVAGNPFYDAAAPSSWRSRVYASGFRSPFRLSLDPATGAPVVGDVGWNTWEEINLVRPGANYGWPCWEGNTQTPGYRDLPGCAGKTNTAPLYTYVHGPMGTSVTGGVVYTGASYPEQYRGAYFFGDYASQRVYTLRYDAQGRLVRAPEANGFGVENGLPVKFGTAGNGDIVYADIGGSRLKRLVYAAGNRPPTAEAVITSDPVSDRTFTFDASRSTDLDGGVLTYAWDFGDGTTATGVRVTHTYGGTGTQPLTARLTVTDSQGARGTSTLTVVPGNRVPTLTLVAPPATERYVVGERVQLSATAVDDGVPLPVTWSVVLVHCSGGYCHDHPGPSFTGDRYDVPFEDHGDDTRLQITASATDEFGVRAEQIFVALPQLRTLTIASTPPSAVTVNGTPRATAQVTAGARISVSAPTVAGDGVATFTRWSDGQPRERQVVMPDSDLTLRAEYTTPIDLRYSSDAALRALLGAPVGAERGDSSLRARDYAAGRIYWTPAHGAREVHGSILAAFDATGAERVWGAPRTDERRTPDGRGRFNAFTFDEAHFYWTPTTGAHVVHGAILRQWRTTGFERGPHGYPRTDERPTPNQRGRYNSFENGGIYWAPGLGARSVLGAIYAKWGQFRWEAGLLGFPRTSELPTPDLVGRYNHFEGGSVYWSPRTGAHEVHGLIRDRWAALGWEQSYLGYPTSDEFAIPGGRRTDFERGYITWTASTGRVVDRRY